ncbi:MAG TPA: hypothetical protein VIV06_06360 [Candidatus Limnocylindrales bacterium]
MSARFPRRLARLLAAAALAIQAGLAIGPVGAAGATGFRLDLAEPRDFVAQTNFVQCVGASMQMMLNILRPGSDRTAATQLELQNVARRLSPSRRDGIVRDGASAVGWSEGLNELGAGPYKLVGLATLDEALVVAARAISETHRPVGLLVWRGRHAWVMSGFEATADPLSGRDFAVTRAIVLDPLYPHGSSLWGPSPRPRQALAPSALGRQFVPRHGWRITGGTVPDSPMADLNGKYVLVLPYSPIVLPRSQLLL